MVVESNSPGLTIENILSKPDITTDMVTNFVRSFHNYRDKSGAHTCNHLIFVSKFSSRDIFQGKHIFQIDGEDFEFDFSSLNREHNISGLMHDTDEDASKCIKKCGKHNEDTQDYELKIEFSGKNINFERNPSKQDKNYMPKKFRDMGIGEFPILVIKHLTKVTPKEEDYTNYTLNDGRSSDKIGVRYKAAKERLNKVKSKLADYAEREGKEKPIKNKDFLELNKEAKFDYKEAREEFKDIKSQIKDCLYLDNKRELASEMIALARKVAEDKKPEFKDLIDLCAIISSTCIKIIDNRHNAIPERHKAAGFAIGEVIMADEKNLDREYLEIKNPYIKKYEVSEKILIDGLRETLEILKTATTPILEFDENKMEVFLEDNGQMRNSYTKLSGTFATSAFQKTFEIKK